ncbi:MAG: thiol reductant ABC exporter subunit CydD [Ectothiorhodospiraceae bacterium]|nr:thiol reductant ABC exporter subunit CydD [Ectothiorhodospiraceae bacterium]MCH8503653.1 thiol reductant ABC exporter subunit CydD [Ectothiorhodospiraceae bacterium]
MTQATQTEADVTALAGEPASADSATIHRCLHDWTRHARPRLLSATLCGLLNGLLLIPQAWLIALLVTDILIRDAGVDAMATSMVALGVVMLSRVALQALRDMLAARAGQDVTTALRRKLLAHLHTLGPAPLRTRDSGQLASAALEQIDGMQQYVVRYLPQRFIAVAVPLAILIAVSTQDWLAGLLLLLSAPLIPLFMGLVGMGAASANRDQFQALARLSSRFIDRIQGLATLKHFGQGERISRELADGADEYRVRTMRVLRIAFLSSAVLEFFSSVAIAMLAIYIGLGLLDFITFGPAPALTLQSGLFILLLAPEFFNPLRELATHYHDRASAAGAAAELIPLLSLTPQTAPRGTRALRTDNGVTVKLRGISLGYGNGRPVVQDVDLTLPAGRTLLLEGPSGSGKTSLLYAVMGLLQPACGEVLINDTRLQELAPDELERQMGWLSQSPQLLPGSVRDNLLLGAPAADDAQLWRACEQAGIEDLLRLLPEGLDTPVGERGVGLSGGEAQRVALARALVRSPGLLVLDEPTASLDPASREHLLEALRAAAETGMTMLIATHQPAQFPWAHNRLLLAAPGADA